MRRQTRPDIKAGRGNLAGSRWSRTRQQTGTLRDNPRMPLLRCTNEECGHEWFERSQLAVGTECPICDEPTEVVGVDDDPPAELKVASTRLREERAHPAHAREKAREVLRQHAIGRPPVVVHSIARRCGFEVRESHQLGKLSARLVGKVIEVSADDPPVRKRFSVAHELGHHFLGTRHGDGPLAEREADAFAGELLAGVECLVQSTAEQGLLEPPDSLAAWARRFHGESLPLVAVMADRYPLIVLHGDIGSGKTAFAEGAADRLCRATRREGTLLKLSTRVRGVGHVGQMNHRINQAFAAVETQAGRKRATVLLIDEADSLAASRDQVHSHHEDKVAVNTLIQKIDDVRRLGGRVLVILCTNRLAALDPALLRRAALQERFERPDDAERVALLTADTDGLGISPQALDQTVALTGPGANDGLGFTFSDLRTRLLPEAVLRAYPDRPLADGDLLETAREMGPSPTLVAREIP